MCSYKYIANVTKVFDVIAIIDLSRAPGKIRPMHWRCDGLAMTLTVSVHYMWAAGFGEVPKYQRFVTAEEMAKLQGLQPDVVKRLRASRSCRVRVLGNAMPLPCIGIVMACVHSGHSQ